MSFAKKVALAGLAIGWSMLASAACAQASHLIAPTDIAALRLVADPQIAPDGHRVIYSIRTPGDPAKLGPTRLWTVTMGGVATARPLPGGEDGDHAARWSPDGRTIGFLATRGSAPARPAEPSSQLWLATPFGAPAHQLTRLAGSVTGFRWSPDASRIALLLSAGPASPPPVSGAVEVDRHLPTTRVYLVDVASGASRVLTAPDRYVFDLDWSPDGQRLVIRYGDGPGLEYFWYQSRVAVIDLHGSQIALLAHHATALHPSFSPDGRRVVYGYFQADGLTGSVAIHALAGGNDVMLGQNWDGSLRDLQWDADGHSLTALGFEDVSPLFVSVDATNGKVTPRQSFKGDPYEFSRANDGTLAFAASTREQPEEIWSLATDRLQVLTDINPQVRQWKLGRLREVQWHSSRDATIVHGLLMLPPDARPGRPVKALVQIHGGPYDAWADGWLGSWHNWAQLLAGHGYAVLMPNPRGSDGRGDAYAKGNVGDWGGGDYQDVLDGVDMLEKQGIIDPARVAIAGWSYGGEMSAWAAGHPNHFRTAIMGAGVTDLASMTLTSDVGRSFIMPYFGDPVRDRAKYQAHSPLTFVHEVHMPVLIMHGEQDARVPIFQSEMFYTALKAQAAIVEMVRFPGAPHWFGGTVGPAYEADVQQRVLDWLNRYDVPEGERQASSSE
jgi:dipeptidyl aminopeptidase/acylaminoacyl peptidase